MLVCILNVTSSLISKKLMLLVPNGGDGKQATIAKVALASHTYTPHAPTLPNNRRLPKDSAKPATGTDIPYGEKTFI